MCRGLATAVALLLAALPAQGQPVRRLAVVAGNNEGGDGTRPLLYARADARRIHEILLRLGGVRPEDAALLLDGTAEELLAALGQMERTARKAAQRGERTALIVYYSGHAKDGALRLGSTRLPFDVLKDRLASSTADIRIGIFDSCRSGALARTKGARRAPAFEIDTGAGRAARGLVILTSSAPDEESQEADPLGGSYFTHHLASGLLGGADRGGDGRVSLAEAYSYAYDRTVADTAESAAGAQHPTFSYELAGNGELVLTDVVARTEGVLFPAGARAGVYYLVDSRGLVVAEVWKDEGVERRIALPPGRYRIKRRLPDHLRIAELSVAAGAVARVEEALFHDAPFSDDPVKGGSPHEPAARFDLSLFGGYQIFFDAPERGGYFPSLPLWGLEGAWRDYLRRNWVLGLDLALGRATSTLVLRTIALEQRSSEVTLGASLWVEWPMGSLAPFAGARLGMLFNTRQLSAGPYSTQVDLTWSPGLVAGARWRLGRTWSLVARSRLHYVLLVTLDERRSLGYLELGALVSHVF